MNASPLPTPDFRLLFESVPGLYLVLTPDLTIVAASDAYLTTTMTRREEVLGKGLFEVFPDNPEDLTSHGTSNLRRSLERVLRNKAPDTMAVQKYDIRRPAAEGGGFEVRYWSPVNSPVLGPDDQIVYLLHRVEDVTEFVRLRQRQTEQDERALELQGRTERMEAEVYLRAQEVQEANRIMEGHLARLEEANRELDSFSYSVSHDLRAPLRAVTGFSQILEEDHGPQLDEECRRLVGIIRRESLRMGQLIDDLLAFSRLGRQNLASVPVDMEALVKEVAKEVLVGAPEPALDLGPLPPAQGDRAMLRQVWVNLLSNALKYSSREARPRIRVGGEKVDGVRRYFIEDNGVGFDMKYYGKLFGVFQRLHTTGEFPGTGVGLAIVHRVVSRHGGRVWAESAPGQGATFHFEIPQEADHA
ncbi:MAG TPA: ATP-binding protein [Holophagaceae bacterium]|nr:ATP-binding protein [Holophagaceae bacterium]